MKTKLFSLGLGVLLSLGAAAQSSNDSYFSGKYSIGPMLSYSSGGFEVGIDINYRAFNAVLSRPLNWNTQVFVDLDFSEGVNWRGVTGVNNVICDGPTTGLPQTGFGLGLGLNAYIDGADGFTGGLALDMRPGIYGNTGAFAGKLQLGYNLIGDEPKIGYLGVGGHFDYYAANPAIPIKADAEVPVIRFGDSSDAGEDNDDVQLPISFRLGLAKAF